MNHYKLQMIIGVWLSVLLLSSCSSPLQPLDTPTPIPPTTTPVPPTSTPEQYQVLTEADGLVCGAYVAEITYEYDGKPDGKLARFNCLNKAGNEVPIALASKSIKKGEIVTVEFGIIRMEMDGGGMPGIAYFTGKQTLRAVTEKGQLVYARFYLTTSQIHQLRKYLGW